MNKSKMNVFFPRYRLWTLAVLVAIMVACLVLYFRDQEPKRTSIYKDPSAQQQLSDKAVRFAPPFNTYVFSSKQLPSGYSPELTFKAQLPILKAAADRGNSNAACVLAWAAELCGLRRNELPLDLYPPNYLANLSDKNVEKFAEVLEFREQRISALCSDIDSNDVGDTNQRLLQSALAGNARSMLKFALSPAKSDKNKKPAKNDFALVYQTYAESMLNRAANAGDLEAIANISSAYSSGSITSDTGSLPVKADLVKSIAATRALALISKELKKQEMPSFYDTDGDAELEEGIRTTMGHMSPAQRKRVVRLEFAYYQAYQAAPRGDRFDRDPLDDLPEQACAETSLIAKR